MTICGKYDSTGERIGNGSTADAARYQKITGVYVKGKDHIQKAKDERNRIDRWIRSNGNEYNPKASKEEIEIAKKIKNDLVNALNNN